MLTRTSKLNTLPAIALLACLAVADAAPADEHLLGPCREQNYSLIVPPEAMLGRRPVKGLQMPKAEYPEEAYKSGIHGKVTLSVRFLAGGRVGTVEVVKGLPGGLSEEAVRAAKKIRFVPARQDGRMINTTENVDYYFANPRSCSLQ
jgi:protein TonB